MKELKLYLLESKDNIKHIRGDFEGKFENNDGILEYYDMPITIMYNKDAIEIQTLVVFKKRNKIGTKLLEACIKYAKEIKKDIILFAGPLTNDISQEDLIEFYKKSGFEQIHGMSKGYLIYKI